MKKNNALDQSALTRFFKNFNKYLQIIKVRQGSRYCSERCGLSLAEVSR
jgi:hypothetical protein